ncbi:hypothetical protein GGI20_005752, partial [Coemansia sp. BCRC 34301]
PSEAREQLKSAFEQSRFSLFKPFRTFTRRSLVARPKEDDPFKALPPVLASASSVDSLVPGFLATADRVFWFCRHASFKQDHIITQLQALEGPQRSALDNDMVTIQSWIWRHLRLNSQLLYGDGDDRVLPRYGESSEDGYSDRLWREIQTDQLETSRRRARLETVELERVAEVRRILQQRQTLLTEEWLAKQQPRLELRASYLWRRNVAKRGLLEKRLNRLVDEHLPKMQQAVVDSGVARKAEMVKLCENLRPTTDAIAEIKWLLELTAGPQPLPLRQPISKQARDRSPRRRKSVRPRKRMTQRYHSIGYSCTLPGLSIRQGRPSRSACAIATDDDDTSDDSMADFIDDDDEVPPVANAGSTTGRFASMDLSGTTLAPAIERSIVSGPSMSADMFAAELRRVSADVMYSSAVGYIRQLAQGVGSFDSADTSDSSVSASIALRVWAEFKNWVHTVRPAVHVQYASREERDKAKRQLHHLLAIQKATANVEISIKPSPRWVPKQYALVANSVLDTPLLHVRAKDCPRSRLPSGSLSRSLTSLFIDGRHSPEILHVMHDQGVAQYTAFSMFYQWRQRSEGAKRAPAMALFEGGSDSNNNTRQSCRKRARDDLASSDDDNDSAPAVDTPTLKAEAEVAEGLVLSSLQPSEPALPMTPAKGGRRNIRPIREENAEVLEMRRAQQQVSQEISRRLQEAAVESSSNPGPIVRQQAPVIVAIEDDDDDEVVMSGSIPTTVARAEPAATINIDIGQIGSPVQINPGFLEGQSKVMIPGFIAGNLKSHQIGGVRFMWRSLVMLSNHRRGSGGSSGSSSSGRRILSQHGCILAHSMGLGKTLQTIALIYTLLNEVSAPIPAPEFAESDFATRRVLILCPATVQANWTDEFWKWTGVQHSLAPGNAYHRALDGPILPPGYGGESMSTRSKLLTLQALRRETRRVLTQVVSFGLLRSKAERLSALGAWHRHGGVVIMGYQGFRDLMKTIDGRGSKSASPSDQARLRRYLLDEGPCLIVADEGHTIKNSDSQLAIYANMLASKARVCLTGYPLQNNLIEYWTMVEFCFPKFLGDLADFRNSYVNPIANGLYLDSSPSDKRMSTLRMKALHSILDGIVDRRDMSILHHQLPRKAEFIIYCPLTPAQMRLYGAFLAQCVGILPESDPSSVVQAARGGNLIGHCAMLTAICNHPAVCHTTTLKSSSNNASATTADRAKSVRDHAVSLSIDDEADLDRLDALAQELGDGNMSGLGTEWCKDIFAHDPDLSENLNQPSLSLKVVLLLDIIRHSIALGERVLVFSRSIPTLDYLQKTVDVSGILDVTGGHSLRMDGSTLVTSRQALVDSFNAPNSPHYVFFISSRTGSIGVNLVAASRVIIFDVGWNPLYDEQAIARAYRYGQTRRVYVYRLMTFGTWEDNLFSNNTFKVAMTRRVVDRQTTGRRNTREDMRRYYQHPPLVSPTITDGELARLTEEYCDDSVFTSLLTRYAPTLAKVVPQATLVAEEEENLLEGDTELIQSLVQSELERFGHIPASSSSSSVSAAMPLAVSSSRAHLPGAYTVSRPTDPLVAGASTVLAMSTNGRSPRPFNIRDQNITVAKGIFHVLRMRLADIPPFPPENVQANERRNALISVFQSGYNCVEAYINEAGANTEQRHSMLLKDALPGFCSDSICKLVNDMYSLGSYDLKYAVFVGSI